MTNRVTVEGEEKLESAVESAVDTLEAGGLVVYPTETVYGLGADALSDEAIRRVYEAKTRPRDKPLSLALPSVSSADDVATFGSTAEEFMRRFLPGPVTPVLPKRDTVPDSLTSGSPTVGVRIPDDAVARRIAEEFGPLTSTSANVSGRGSARTADDVDEEILEEADLVVDSGGTEYGVGSTVVDVETWEVVREGALADDVVDWIEERNLG
ncbi:MAG: L-threonylcarbamoyladenylate synthase [Halobacteria archaeon]|nr:L-threonylcarbamoyladenylate synthase [Halobacteria archaeon]